MIIQIVLVAGFVTMLLIFLARANTSQTKAWKKIFGVLFASAAVVAVLFPSLIDDVAHDVGVGRGADLLLYMITMAFIASQVSNYAKRKQDNQLFVRLARKIAIIEAKNKRAAK